MKAVDEVILLVGGFGTRLQAVVPDMPKPLAPVAGRPFLAYLLDRYAAAGMRRAILATGYRADQVRAFAGNRWEGMDIVYSHEETPLGTGGAIRQAASMLEGGGVHVTNGDTFLRYSPLSLQEATCRLGTSIGVALVRVQDVGRYGAVESGEGRVRAFLEKGGVGPGLINAGSYFLAESALAALPDKQVFSFETDVLLPATMSGEVAAHAETSDFIDIGVPEDYGRAQVLFKEALSE